MIIRNLQGWTSKVFNEKFHFILRKCQYITIYIESAKEGDWDNNEGIQGIYRVDTENDHRQTKDGMKKSKNSLKNF